MKIEDAFVMGGIMEPEDKKANIKNLSEDDCIITGKFFNKDKIILHVKREIDGVEGNIFLRPKEGFEDQHVMIKKVLNSKKTLGISLNELKEVDIEEL